AGRGRRVRGGGRQGGGECRGGHDEQDAAQRVGGHRSLRRTGTAKIHPMSASRENLVNGSRCPVRWPGSRATSSGRAPDRQPRVTVGRGGIAESCVLEAAVSPSSRS